MRPRPRERLISLDRAAGDRGPAEQLAEDARCPARVALDLEPPSGSWSRDATAEESIGAEHTNKCSARLNRLATAQHSWGRRPTPHGFRRRVRARRDSRPRYVRRLAVLLVPGT